VRAAKYEYIPATARNSWPPPCGSFSSGPFHHDGDVLVHALSRSVTDGGGAGNLYGDGTT
jgi:hypothetical protein